MRTRRISKAFTLVEILIVVVILGILAAIVVPQFTNATDEARNGNVVSQQKTLENQLELYRAQTGAYPDFDETLWETMIDHGTIKTAPINPFTGGSDVGDEGSGADWEIYLDDNDNAVVRASGAE